MTLPRVGDVYETTLPGAVILLCVHVREIKTWGNRSYDFLVLDGGDPSIRTWSSHGFRSPLWEIGESYEFSMEATMRNFCFKKIA